MQVEQTWVEPVRRTTSERVEMVLDSASALARARAAAERGGRVAKAEVERLFASGGLFPSLDDWSLNEACVVGEMCGRVLVSEPWTEAVVVADMLRQHQASPHAQAVEALMSGRKVAAWAGNDLPGYWGAAPSIRADGSGEHVLSGRVSAVAQVEDADWLLLAAHDQGGPSLVFIPVDMPGLRLERRECLDLTRARYDVSFDDVRVPADAVLGTRGGASAALDRQVGVAIPLALSQSVGAMKALVERAVTHAKSRIAFGRPIGSFQAVKQLLVDASLGLETSAAMCEAATQAVETARSDAAEILSMAKAYVARTALEVAHAVWQVLGGVAYMWDDDFHLYLRRLTAEAAFLGPEDWHNQRIVAIHGAMGSGEAR